MSIQRWADDAMFPAVPMEDNAGLPRVRLLWMTPDPLGANAAMCRMYEGLPCYSLDDIDDAERRRYFETVQNTKLKAPLESIKLHFFIEGISRSTTHQLVRQRTAAYAQESLRFAVKESIEVIEPPTIRALGNSPKDQLRREVWDNAVATLWQAYTFLVEDGIPAEDARELLPHATATRLHYVTDLRNLVEHAGNRLCTQAVPVWRLIFSGIVDCIRNYDPSDQHPMYSNAREWQFHTIADSMLFRPACYQQGKCPFNSDIDRGCTIRSRVDAFAKHGIPSSVWPNGAIVQSSTEDEGAKGSDFVIPGIRDEEWAVDINAGRTHRAG